MKFIIQHTDLTFVLYFEQRPPPEVYDKNGNIRNCNQGRYTLSLDESPCGTKLIFNLEVPKFMTTDALNVDLQP